MRLGSQDAVERNLLVGIKKMIDVQRTVGAVPGKRLFRQKLPLVHLIISVRVTAARQAKAKVRIRAEQTAEADFGIQVNRRDGQAQGQVGVVEEGGLIVIKKGVAGDGLVSFERLIVAKLDQFAFDRINLPKSKGGAEDARQKRNQKP